MTQAFSIKTSVQFTLSTRHYASEKLKLPSWIHLERVSSFCNIPPGQPGELFSHREAARDSTNPRDLCSPEKTPPGSIAPRVATHSRSCLEVAPTGSSSSRNGAPQTRSSLSLTHIQMANSTRRQSFIAHHRVKRADAHAAP